MEMGLIVIVGILTATVGIGAVVAIIAMSSSKYRS